MRASLSSTIPFKSKSPIRIRANIAATFFSVFIVTVQSPIPEHSVPDQPVNAESGFGMAVRVTNSF